MIFTEVRFDLSQKGQSLRGLCVQGSAVGHELCEFILSLNFILLLALSRFTLRGFEPQPMTSGATHILYSTFAKHWLGCAIMGMFAIGLHQKSQHCDFARIFMDVASLCRVSNSHNPVSRSRFCSTARAASHIPEISRLIFTLLTPLLWGF